jgi:hypothetical protein
MPARLLLALTVFSSNNSATPFSWNIQGTFRESSADAREPPSQLPEALKKKKVPRLTQNTTSKHEYLGRGLTRPNDVSGNIQGTFRAHSGHIQGTIKENLANIQATFSSTWGRRLWAPIPNARST